ncbi:hypothetical protein BJ508DRAFT_410170 [Ascobolus immersus RN42]|uniref:Galactose oxidase n=1 Tax=Ascobolus immersus RN42 TaxID=1160509 RepID=A0A3N4IPP9_ASCIM|nr:hypothetical protein BJ508DRAFT_410170 [Ascobolus immersus RN42]
MRFDSRVLLETRQTTPSSSFCGWENGATTVIDKTLYISSGMLRTPSKTDIKDTQNAHPSIDGENQLLAQSLSSKTPLLSGSFEPISKPSDIPTLRNGAIWTSTDKIYEFGGLIVNPETQKAVPDDQSYAIYDISTKKWSQKPLPENVRRYSGGSTQGNGMGFYYKGKVTSASTSGVVGEKHPTDMVIFNMEKEEFRIVPGDPDSIKEGTYLTMSFSQFGKNGTVISMGGLGFRGLISYDIASVYDIASETWYRVSLSGPRPDKRIGQCSVSISAPDGSSHQIFVYGGFDPNGSGHDDIYVLSIPSFSWQKVWAGEDKKLARTAMACTTVGKSMVVLGGTVVNNRSNCEERPARTVFDLTELKWNEDGKVDPDADYSVADVIMKNIEGRTEPVGGWTRDGLKEVFALKSKDTSPGNDSGRDEPASGGGPQPSDDGDGGSKGAIIGGVVGGIIGALAIAFLLYLILRRRKEKSSGPSFAELPGSGPDRGETYKPSLTQFGGHGEVHGSPPAHVAVSELEGRRSISELGVPASELGVAESTLYPGDSASVVAGGFRSELPGSVPAGYQPQIEHPKICAELQRDGLEGKGKPPRYG